MHIARSAVIDRHIEEVFDYVADASNDPAWCDNVLSVEQVAGEGPGPAPATTCCTGRSRSGRRAAW